MSANTGSLGDLQRAFQDYLLASSESFQAAVRDTGRPTASRCSTSIATAMRCA